MSDSRLHQWEPLDIKTVDLNYTDGRVYRTIRCKQCVKCGLRKGHTEIKRFGTTVYYEGDDILSIGILPFKCSESGRIETEFELKRKAKQFKKELLKKKEFIVEDEFYV